jgi:Ca-activated chloride channel family protein
MIRIWFFLLLLAVSDKGRQANIAYEKGQFEEAIRLYQEALREDPKNAKLYFNLGNALSKAGKMEDALGAWETFRSLSETPSDKARAEYNMAHTLGKMQQWDKALALYKEALRKSPRDEEARYNYELALKQKQEQQKNQQQDQKQDKDQKKQDDQKQNQQQQQQDQQQQQQPPQDQQQQQPKPKPKNEMSKDQAEKILKALENKEKDLLKDLKKQKATQRSNDKDW